MKQDKESLNKIICTENRKFIEITDEKQNTVSSLSNGLNEMKIKYEELEKEYNYLDYQFKRSEKIRIEQNNLIKTLQNDINTLKGRNEQKMNSDNHSLNITNEIENPFLKNAVTTAETKKKIKKKKINKTKSKSVIKTKK
jgi:CDP-diacylglycerol pyrophosphatase